MCGIYAIFTKSNMLSNVDIKHLAKTAQIRGVDSAGLVFQANNNITIK